MYQVALICREVSWLPNANEAQSRRKIKKYVCRSSAIYCKDAQDIPSQKSVNGEVVQEANVSGLQVFVFTVQYCGVCGKPGHNARTSQKAADVLQS